MRNPLRPRARVGLAAASALVVAAGLTACGAGSRTGAETAAQVDCPVEVDSPTTVNVLAYNSSAIDPYTNAMVRSCTQGDLTVEHEPIDFAGQTQRTTATLAGEEGTYDVLETYGYIIPQLAADESLVPLDDLVDTYGEEYGLDSLNEGMREAMSYDGSLYAIPMQAQMFLMAYRQDVFDELGLEPPTTFEELRQVSQAIQDAGDFEYPLALPWLASGDITTAYDAALGSLGVDYVDPETMEPNFDTPEAAQALEEMQSLVPFMDPQVTTFDQPAVQQQMYNGDAAIAIMFSGRMSDLANEENTQYAADFGFAPPPSVEADGPQFSALSVDGWSIPSNSAVDDDVLFQVIATSVSEDASEASLPAAYPARDGVADSSDSPIIEAASEAIDNAPPAEPFPWTAPISNETRPVIAEVVLGQTSVEDATARMQQIATDVLAQYS
ncbi:extracellular solute-binding protein [Pseudokineococcus marinus]|uniref:Extracellular solute-binding protein n=1 Tax=Pseudokineococcus marinus TaxID=351215 RepID=A0A849BXY9_9ACTN|nr:extracellular solute-binding protein [Pseudokineococcus marinus]NNH22388.1 extracellular solute-binding protein [Pseudokineococcus marinus]